MANKEPNKNKVTRKKWDSMEGMPQEEIDAGIEQKLEKKRRQLESSNLTQEERNNLLADEARLVGDLVNNAGTQYAQMKDLAAIYDNIHTTQQEQTKTVEQFYGIQNKIADKLQLAASQTAEIATLKRQTRDMSLEDLNINQRTADEQSDLNRLSVRAVKHAQKLTLFNKENIPYYDKVKSIQAEIAVLTQQVGDNVDSENAHRLKTLKHMEKEYETLGKLEKKNERIEEMQGSINDLMSGQGTAAGKIFNVIKDIITNPLLIFTGLLALGVQRFEEMRGRGNDLAEEMDRVNKKLAGAGPYQDAIIRRARKIHGIFRAAGEGFASSMESAVDAVQALETSLGGINFVTSGLVDIMTDLKLSINLSDDDVAKVINTYLTVDGLSEKAAINSAEMLYSMSEQAGINPADTFREIANATGETLAHFKGGGQELNKAVISAKRMGLGLEDVAKISKGLLDFESSIEAEMEAQMLTGMNINFNKARMFAMNKEGAKAAEEVMRQVGGLERYRRMNIFQQEAIAKATGLSVTELLKSNVQREREAKIAKEKQQIHKDTVKMLPLVTSVMGKLDTGLGIIEKISKILGDIVLDVFGVDFAKAEELILRFVKSDTFTTGLKNVLFFMKGVMDGIKSAIVTIWDVLKNMPWIGKFLQNMGSQDMSGGYDGAQKGGKFVGKAMAYGYMAKKMLGMTPLTAMWVQSASGALKGLGKGIFNGIKGLFGGGGAGGAVGGGTSAAGIPYGAYGGTAGAGGGAGGAAAGGMSGGAMMGYGVAAAFVAKGAYDVVTTQSSGLSTGSEKAGALGSLGGALAGAKGGAMIGTMILPGIGTAIGAAIGAGAGYFGGAMVKHISWFQDDLDKARIKLLKSENDLLLRKTMDNSKLRMKQVAASNLVRQSYIDLGLTTKGVTENELEAFVTAQYKAGNITREEFNAGLKGELDPLRLLELAAGGAASQLGIEDQVRKAWVEDQMATNEVDNFMEIERLKVQLDGVVGLTDEMIEGLTKEGLESRGHKLSNSAMVHGVLNDADLKMVAEEMKFLYGDVVSKAEIQKVIDDGFTYSGGYFNKTDKTEAILEVVTEKLETGIKTKLSDAEFKHNKALLKYQRMAYDDMTYDKATGAMVVKVVGDDETATKAVGGLLQGPSHAEGGIKTKFGEMEGGEAVINKKSTAKHMGILSRINQDQGGIAFGEGGVTKFDNGGTTGNHGQYDGNGALLMEHLRSGELKHPDGEWEDQPWYTKANYAWSESMWRQSPYITGGTAPSVGLGGGLGVTDIVGLGYDLKSLYDSLDGNEVSDLLTFFCIGKDPNARNADGSMKHVKQTSAQKNKFDPSTWEKQPDTPTHNTSDIKVPIGTVPTAGYALGGRVDGTSGASKSEKDTYSVNVTKYLSAREMGNIFEVPSHGMWPGHIQSRMVNPDRAVDFGYPPPIDGDPTKYFVDPWDNGNRDMYANRDKTGKGIDTGTAELGYSDMEHYLKVAQTVGPSNNPVGSTGYGWLDSILATNGYNFANQNCADFNAQAFGVDAQKAEEFSIGDWGGVTTPEMAFPLILEKYGGLGGRQSRADMNKGSFNSFLKGDIGDLTGLWDSDENSITNAPKNLMNWGNDQIYKGADHVVENSSKWTNNLFDLDQTPSQAVDNTLKWNKKNIADPVAGAATDAWDATTGAASDVWDWATDWEQGGTLPTSPVSNKQNQFFRDIPITKVNDMIMTKDGQMIETSPDDNIIAKKGGITQKKGSSASGGGSADAKDMINLLRELIIVNKNARVKLDGTKLAQSVNSANYMNG